MSINVKEQIKCPSCGQLSEMTVWESITAVDSPDLKAELLCGRLNIFRCASCGAAALVPNPVLYTDSEKRLMITFVPSADMEKHTNLLAVRSASKASGELDGISEYNLRFVSTYNEFLEKILIFDNGLQDKVIEVLKILVLSQEPEKMEDRTCIFGKKDSGGIEFMVQDKKEGMVYTSRVPEETYDTIFTQLKNSGVKYKSFDWELVDPDYAAALLRGVNNPL